MDLVFVYGTLQRGGDLSAHLDDRRNRFLGKVHTKEPCILLDLGKFPGLIINTENYPLHTPVLVRGELWLVHNLSFLDRVEGVPYLYQRNKISVVHNGKERKPWTYVYNNGCITDKLVPNGDWLAYQRRLP